MTDRYSAVIVVLDHPIREDDAEESVLMALRMIKGVASVEPQLSDYSAEETGAFRERRRLRDMLMRWLDESSRPDPGPKRVGL